MAHRIQRLGLGIAQAQARGEASGILGDGNRKRAQTADWIGRQTQRALDRNQGRKRPGIGQAAEDRQRQPAIHHRIHGNRRAIGNHQLQYFDAYPLRRQVRKAIPTADTGKITCAIDVAGTVSGVNSEEAKDAQVVLGNSLFGLTNEADSSCRDVFKAAHIVVNAARPHRPTDR